MVKLRSYYSPLQSSAQFARIYNFVLIAFLTLVVYTIALLITPAFYVLPLYKNRLVEYKMLLYKIYYLVE